MRCHYINNLLPSTCAPLAMPLSHIAATLHKTNPSIATCLIHPLTCTSTAAPGSDSAAPAPVAATPGSTEGTGLGSACAAVASAAGCAGAGAPMACAAAGSAAGAPLPSAAATAGACAAGAAASPAASCVMPHVCWRRTSAVENFSREAALTQMTTSVRKQHLFWSSSTLIGWTGWHKPCLSFNKGTVEARCPGASGWLRARTHTSE